MTLRNGFKFHYLCSDVPGTPVNSRSNKPLVIFMHGFPDSWAIWRHILSSASIRDSSILVAVDLPGYGGSDGMKKYTATEVLESLTEFIVAIREQYGIDHDPTAQPGRKVIIVGHDWGCVLAMRLAAEAPQVADRFILTNGPLVSVIVIVHCSLYTNFFVLVLSLVWSHRTSVAYYPPPSKCSKHL